MVKKIEEALFFMKLIIEQPLTDLNTYIDAERTNRFIAAKIKKADTEIVYWACRQQKLKPFKGKVVEIMFTWYCKNMKKDKDNICFAKKAILDGMVKAKVLKNDGWKDIGDFADRFEVDAKNPRVEVEIL